MTVTLDEINAALQAPIDAAAAVDLARPEEARAELERRYPSDGPEARKLGKLLQTAAQQGVICDRGKDPVRYSRLSKPGTGTRDFSVDFVWMTGPGIPHRHPRGEINLCFAVEGEAKFDGRPAGWVTFAPDTRHIPTVTDGRMLIAYFLPAGEVEWIEAGEV